MKIKQQIMERINAYLEEEVFPNKLEIIMNYDGFAAMDIETDIRLKDIYFSNAETSHKSDGYNTYKTINHVFVIDEKEATLSIAEYNDFSGIYPLDDYHLYWDTSSGTDLHTYADRRNDEFSDLGLHKILNSYDFYEAIYEDSKWFDKFAEEQTLSSLESLSSDIEQYIPGLLHFNICPYDEDLIELHLSTGLILRIAFKELKDSIKKARKAADAS